MEVKYKKFWNWFTQNRRIFEGSAISEESIEIIDREISELGNFAWEIGPGQLKPLFLAISPGGDSTLLPDTRKIISYAPVLENWEFYYAKPIKNWENYFEVYINEEKVGIDISSWEYILFRVKRNIYDIQVKPMNLPSKVNAEKEEMLNGLVEMVVQAIIGEELRLERINALEVVSKFGSDPEESASSILDIKKHLDSLI